MGWTIVRPILFLFLFVVVNLPQRADITAVVPATKLPSSVIWFITKLGNNYHQMAAGWTGGLGFLYMVWDQLVPNCSQRWQMRQAGGELRVNLPEFRNSEWVRCTAYTL